ncbi:MAG: hypothetical protein ACW97Z_04665 [Candidatus Hodarchaeales archaeon]|jgi:hypothetical protein
MIETVIIQIFVEIINIFISIPFGLVSITFGSIIYVPTGAKLGKYILIFGLIVLTLNVYLV